MKIRVMDDVFKDDMRLYMEHIWVDHHVCPAERKYIALAYIAYGSGTVIIGNERFDASAKDIFVVLPGIKAEFISRNMSAENYDLEIHYIFFEKEFLRGEWERYGEEFSDLERFFDGTGQYYIKAADNEMSEIRNYIVRMTNEYYEYAPGRESALFGQLLSILPIVFRHHNVKEERLFSRNMLVDQTIRQVSRRFKRVSETSSEVILREHMRTQSHSMWKPVIRIRSTRITERRTYPRCTTHRRR